MAAAKPGSINHIRRHYVNRLRLNRKIPVAAILLWGALLAGCGGGMSGTYSDSNGLMSIKFESSSAYVTLPIGTTKVSYEVDGDKIVLKNPQGDLVLIRNKDGSLGGLMGTLTKAGS